MPFNISHLLVPAPTTKKTALIFRCGKWTEDSALQRGYTLAILSEHSGVHSSRLWWKLFWEHTRTQQEMELFTNTKSRCLFSFQINLIYFILQNSDSQKLGLTQFPMIIHYLCWDVSPWRIKVLPDSGSITRNDKNVKRKLWVPGAERFKEAQGMYSQKKQILNHWAGCKQCCLEMMELVRVWVCVCLLQRKALAFFHLDNIQFTISYKVNANEVLRPFIPSNCSTSTLST